MRTHIAVQALKATALSALFALILLAPAGTIVAQSCCCTGTGSNYSILPNMDKHVVGLRYTFGSYNTTVYTMQHMQMGNMDMSMMGPGKPAMENINTLEAFGRFNLPKGFQLSAFIPVHFLTERTTTAVNRTGGLGDISLLLQYSVLNPKSCCGPKGKHQLRLGAGLKLPTGLFKMTNDGMFATDLQLGTGSFDFLFNTIYTYRYKQFGLNISASYKKNLVNAQHFRFGDKVKVASNVFYLFKLPKEVMVMPALGAGYNYSFYNIYQKQALTYTGGQYLSADAGFDMYYKQFAISTTFSPVLLSVSNWQGAPYPTWHFETGVYYNFSTNSKKHRSNEPIKSKSI